MSAKSKNSLLPTRRQLLAAAAATPLAWVPAEAPKSTARMKTMFGSSAGYADLSCYGQPDYSA